MNILEIPGDRLLVRQDEAKKVTTGGIALADKYQRAPNTGTIIMVGDEVNTTTRPDGRLRRLWQPNERVMFTQFAGAPIVLDDVVCVILTPDEVLAVIAPEDVAPQSAAPDAVPVKATGDVTPPVRIATL